MSAKQNGFIRFDTIEEFKDWLFSQKVYRSIYRLQVHHMEMPDYSTWEGTDKRYYGDNRELGRTISLDSYGKTTWHYSDGHGHYIAQHFNIFPNGKITTGRNLNSIPVGIKGWNTGAICIENYGCFDKDKMTKEQRETIIAVYALLCKRFNITPSSNTIRYHCWFTAGGYYLGGYVPGKSCKTCPGKLFFGGNTMSRFKTNFLPAVEKYMNDGKFVDDGKVVDDEKVVETKPVEKLTVDENVKSLQKALNDTYDCGLVVDGLCGNKTKSAIKTHYLKAVDDKKKEHTVWVQKALNLLKYKVTEDGYYGNKTASAIKRFQKNHNLDVDGYAGLNTHLELIELLNKYKRTV